MEEIEVSVDDQQEAINHHAAHGGERWLLHCALISAVLAVAAAISGLYASHYANEAVLEQMHASDHWGYYQAKGIKAMLSELRADLATNSGKAVPDALQQKIDGYRKEQDDIKEQALDETNGSTLYLQRHEALARAVSAFQVAIAITAMAAICRRKHLLILTLMLALAGGEFVFSAFWM